MPAIDDSEYNALVYVARSLELERKIDWNVPEIKAYEQLQGESKCGDADEKRKAGSALSSRRSRFKARARKYAVGIGGKGRRVLMKEGKPVLRKDEYPDVLHRFHDQMAHSGSKKLRAVVSLIMLETNRLIGTTPVPALFVLQSINFIQTNKLKCTVLQGYIDKVQLRESFLQSTK